MPSRPVRSAAALALATSATTFAYAGSVAPAHAAGYDGVCKTSSGVTVVVDFRNLGGGIAVRCSPVGSGATGLDALQAAGIPLDGTRQYGLAFICRMYGQPSATTTLPGGYHESCGRTPPPNAHWWYEQAPNGGSWTSSGAGASTNPVIPGGFEGWAFSEGGTNYAPRFTPSRPASAPQPPPSHTTTTKPPAPPSHTTTKHPTGSQHGSSTSRQGGAAPSSTHGGRSSADSHPKSTTSSTTAEQKSKAAKSNAAKASKKAKAANSASSSASSKSSAAGSSSTGAAAGTSSGAPTSIAGAPMANSNELIKDANKSSGLNATTIVGGLVLAALVVGGGAVAIIRRRNLG